LVFRVASAEMANCADLTMELRWRDQGGDVLSKKIPLASVTRPKQAGRVDGGPTSPAELNPSASPDATSLVVRATERTPTVYADRLRLAREREKAEIKKLREVEATARLASLEAETAVRSIISDWGEGRVKMDRYMYLTGSHRKLAALRKAAVDPLIASMGHRDHFFLGSIEANLLTGFPALIHRLQWMRTSSPDRLRGLLERR